MLLIIIITILVNIPLGIWRARQRKFSLQWFIAVHASIPLIYYLRMVNGISNYYIPLMIAVAVSGQLLGGILFPKNKKQTQQ